MLCNARSDAPAGDRAKSTPVGPSQPHTSGTDPMRPPLMANRQQTQNASAVATSFAKAMEVRKAMAVRSAAAGAMGKG